MAESYTSSYTNIIVFILTTYVYFLFKPTIKLDELSDPEKLSINYTNTYTFLAIYLLVVIIIQIVINVNVINGKCGGSVSENIGFAGVITILPWLLIFGVLLIVLTIYPTFKSAFSDVIGYYWVSSSANNIITEILKNKGVEDSIDENLPPDEKKRIQNTADALIKICGDTGLLINQITPQNFLRFWDMLTPLKKDEYKDDNNDITKTKKEELLNLVLTRENIGEAMWYIYTGSLVASVVQLKITSRGCSRNLKTMEKNWATFKDEQAEAAEKEEVLKNEVSQEINQFSSFQSNNLQQNVNTRLNNNTY